jgi:hypothetical protein
VLVGLAELVVTRQVVVVPVPAQVEPAAVVKHLVVLLALLIVVIQVRQEFLETAEMEFIGAVAVAAAGMVVAVPLKHQVVVDLLTQHPLQHQRHIPTILKQVLVVWLLPSFVTQLGQLQVLW